MKKKYNINNGNEILLEFKLIDIINPLVVILIKNNKRENIIKSCKILIKNNYDVYAWLIKMYKSQKDLLLYINENIELVWAMWINDWLTHLVNCLSKIDYNTVFCCEFKKGHFIYSNFDNWLSVISDNLALEQKSKLYDIYNTHINNGKFTIEEEKLYMCNYCNDENDNNCTTLYFYNKYPKYI